MQWNYYEERVSHDLGDVALQMSNSISYGFTVVVVKCVNKELYYYTYN